MEIKFQILLLSYAIFLLFGIVLQYFITNKKNETMKKNGWLKFIFFNLIILSFIVCFYLFPNSLLLFHSLIIIGGSLEVWRLLKNLPSNSKTTISLISISLFTLFVLGSIKLDNTFLIKTLVSIAVFDGFSQLGGKLIGKRKLAPTISPNKTWEGFTSGLIVSFLFGICIHIWIDDEFYKTLIFIPFLALTGDLLASFIKRKAQVKDYSNVIPYQGGFMDRFDSYLFTVSLITLINFIS